MLALAAALTAFSSAALATAPNPEHKVTICHATPADTAAEGWVSITVDVASVGYMQSGHQDEHDADIIPPWSYTDGNSDTVSYDGKNWDATGQAILRNGCKAPDASESAPASETPFESFQGETATPFESFQGETATPNRTAPPSGTADDSSGGSTPLFALLVSGLFGGLGVAAARRQRRAVRS